MPQHPSPPPGGPRIRETEAELRVGVRGSVATYIAPGPCRDRAEMGGRKGEKERPRAARGGAVYRDRAPYRDTADGRSAEGLWGHTRVHTRPGGVNRRAGVHARVQSGGSCGAVPPSPPRHTDEPFPRAVHAHLGGGARIPRVHEEELGEGGRQQRPRVCNVRGGETRACAKAPRPPIPVPVPTRCPPRPRRGAVSTSGCAAPRPLRAPDAAGAALRYPRGRSRSPGDAPRPFPLFPVPVPLPRPPERCGRGRAGSGRCGRGRYRTRCRGRGRSGSERPRPALGPAPAPPREHRNRHRDPPPPLLPILR